MKRIKAWWKERRRRIDRKHWEIGFCWAAGQLLLHQETTRSILCKCHAAELFGKRDAFDEGAIAAIKLLQESDLVKQ